MNPKFFIIIIIFFTFSKAFAQKAVISNYGSATSQEIITASSGEAYQITITIPSGFSKDENYKVLYYLDAWWLTEIINGCYAISFLSDILEPIVLVGISVEGDENTWHKHRGYDYTPTPFEINKMGFTMTAGSVQMDSSNTGGADEFIDFLEKVAFPFVENKYPNLIDRGFMGHSFGGLFGAYILQRRPEIFKDLLLVSPSVWWNKSEILSEESFVSIKVDSIEKNIFLAVGQNESKILVKATNELDLLFSKSSSLSFRHTYKIYKEANHNSVLPQAIYDGLEYLYKFER